MCGKVRYHGVGSGTIFQSGHGASLSAVIAAKEPVATLQPVTDNPYAARFTQRSELGDCTFERIEGVGFAALQDIERCVVLIAAGYTLTHFILPRVVEDRRNESSSAAILMPMRN